MRHNGGRVFGAIRERGEEPRDDELEHGRLPDPEGQAIEDLVRRVDELEQRLQEALDNQSVLERHS
jgi:hypothetical protein